MQATAFSTHIPAEMAETRRFNDIKRAIFVINLHVATEHHKQNPVRLGSLMDDSFYLDMNKVDRLADMLSERFFAVSSEQRAGKRGDLTPGEIETIFLSAVNAAISPNGQTDLYANAKFITDLERWGIAAKANLPDDQERMDEALRFLHEQCTKAWALLPQLRSHGFNCGDVY